MIDHETKVFKNKIDTPTRYYPDSKSAIAAGDEFHARVKAIAEEMGAHSVFAVGHFLLQAAPDAKPNDDKSVQAVVAYGCARCMGYEVARCLSAVFEVVGQFFDGFASGAAERLSKAIAHGVMANKADRAKQKGFDA